MAGRNRSCLQVATSAENVKLSRREVELTRGRFTQGVTDNTEGVLHILGLLAGNGR